VQKIDEQPIHIIKLERENDSLITSWEEPDQVEGGLLPRRTVVLYVRRRVCGIDDLFSDMEEVNDEVWL
jgi:hypothetical protein